ncbi:MAG: hypothetical protein L3K00_00125 [Thermoplasmata archaeon]|nr:hypothetical protein [Thermoplasmata archaeon]
MRTNVALLSVLAALTVTFLVLPAALAGPVPTASAVGNLPVGTTSLTTIHSNASAVAGYEGASLNGSIAQLNASWTQPSVNCTKQNASALFAALLANNKTIQVAGTGVTCTSGVASSYAWYDFNNTNASIVTHISQTTLPVPAGSVVRVTMHAAGGSAIMTITVGTHHFSRTIPFTGKDFLGDVGLLGYPGTNGSVRPLANFGSVGFGVGFSKVAGTNDLKVSGKTLAIGAMPYVFEVTMKDAKHKTQAVPTPLVSSNTSFKVLWKSAT